MSWFCGADIGGGGGEGGEGQSLWLSMGRESVG